MCIFLAGGYAKSRVANFWFCRRPLLQITLGLSREVGAWQEALWWIATRKFVDLR